MGKRRSKIVNMLLSDYKGFTQTLFTKWTLRANCTRNWCQHHSKTINKSTIKNRKQNEKMIFYFWFTIKSLLRLTYHNCREVKILWISLHKFLSFGTTFLKKFLFGAWSVTNNSFLSSVKLIKFSIFFNKSNEMFLNFIHYSWLSFLHCWRMMLFHWFTFFEQLSNLFGCFSFRLLSEFVNFWARCYNIWVLVNRVQNNVEKSNGSAGVVSKLLHVEEILWLILFVQSLCL